MHVPLHDTVLKRYRVAAGSARTIHDYLYPHDFHHFHDSSILPDYYPCAIPPTPTIPPLKSLPESHPTIPPWKSLPESHAGGHSLDPLNPTHAPPQTPLTATQLPTHPALNSSHLHHSNHQSKFWTRGPGPKTFENSLVYVYPPIILLSHL